MKKIYGYLVLMVISLHAPLLFAEAGHAEHAQEAAASHHVVAWSDVASPLLYRSINFVLFVAILVLLLRRPIAAFLANRRKEVEEVIKASAERKAWAEQMYADYDRRLQNIGKEVDALKTSLRKEGEEESKKLVEQANLLAGSLRKEAGMMADAEWEEFKISLRHEVIEKAAQVAKKAVLEAVNGDDQDRLAGEFMRELRSRDS